MPVDLSEALSVVSRSVKVSGQSDNALLTKIQNTKDYVAPRKAMQPAVGLGTGATLRPVEALHQLAYATRPLYQDDVFDRYVHWALLRYLGFFKNGSTLGKSSVPILQVSDAGKRIVGNQRRLASEEMGIGFGCLLGARWFDHDLGSPGMPVSFVDIDVALQNGYAIAGGSKKIVNAATTQIGSKRPDYLMLSPDVRTGRYRVRSLECKGTSTPGYGVPQLAGAVHQLDGVTIDGRIPKGVAVSTLTPNRGAVRYLAVDPGDADEPAYEPMVPADAEDVVLSTDDQSVGGQELVETALRASWATLADFGGNVDAFRRWAPNLLSERLVRQPRERERFETPFGNAVGTGTTFRFDGTALTVRHGIAETVDAALSSGESHRVRSAQIEFAQTVLSGNQHSEPDPQEAISTTSDGSIFVLSLE